MTDKNHRPSSNRHALQPGQALFCTMCEEHFVEMSSQTEGDLEIRRIQCGDLEQTLDLLGQQFHEHEIPLAAAILRTAVEGLIDRAERGCILVAVRGARVVGVAVVALTWTLEHGGAAAWLDELYVDPMERRAGVGRRLVEAATAAAVDARCRALDLEVEPGHEPAVRLYEQLGFHRHQRARWVKHLTHAR